MYLKNLNIIDFKNCGQADLELSPKINCFIGNNGAGKTNILDAIHYLSLTKSFFNPVDSQNINYGKEFFIIQGEFMIGDEPENIYCSIQKNKKKVFKRNQKEYQKLSGHIGYLPLVMISPNDINLILEGSEVRRKFIDNVISQHQKDYLHDLIQYNKALKQRNQLLKKFAQSNSFDTASLETWDYQLCKYGKNIYEQRVNFIEQFLPVFQNYYDQISSGKENVQLTYRSQLHHNSLQNLLKDSVDKDRILQYTTQGIHKDDLLLDIEGHPIKQSGSQGQQKSYLVALKFAKYDFIKSMKKINPIILLDDIFDKFDDERVSTIINLIAGQHFGQIFITETSRDRLEALIKKETDYKIFNVKDGKVE